MRPDPAIIHMFAAQAMQGLITKLTEAKEDKYLTPDPKTIAEMSYMFAEALYEEACNNMEANPTIYEVKNGILHP